MGHHPLVSSVNLPSDSPVERPGVSQRRFIVPADAHGLRLDQCLARCIPELSRRTARVVLDLGGVFVERKRVKVASRKVSTGQRITVHMGSALEHARKDTGAAARAHDEGKFPPPTVLFEDEHLIVVIKPAGLLSAPTPESDRNNLVSMLAHRKAPPEKVYVVHRLDLHTSGVLVLARTEQANRLMSELFRSHALTRLYDVWVQGEVDAPCTCELPVAGRAARTHFTPLGQATPHTGKAFSHLEARLETGRTHQVRIHAAGLGHPVLADARYGRREPWHPPRLALHAKHLAFTHPVTNASLSFDAPLTDDLVHWQQRMSELRARNPELLK